MLQQKSCSRTVEIPGGGGSSKTPLERKFLRGGGCKPKTFRGRGMDIFWNHTFLGRFIFGGREVLIFGRDFASENAAPERMWVKDGGMELPLCS